MFSGSRLYLHPSFILKGSFLCRGEAARLIGHSPAASHLDDSRTLRRQDRGGRPPFVSLWLFSFWSRAFLACPLLWLVCFNGSVFSLLFNEGNFFSEQKATSAPSVLSFYGSRPVNEILENVFFLFSKSFLRRWQFLRFYVCLTSFLVKVHMYFLLTFVLVS